MRHTGTLSSSIVWSALGEIFVKLVNPFTNMALARILAPEAFGVFAVCNMFVSFVDLLTDSGFGKYLIQRRFADEGEKDRYANVAFWSNLMLSFILFILILLCGRPIAYVLGNPIYTAVVSVSSVQIIFTSVTSVQMALMRKDFQFRKLFIIRVAVSFVPVIVTIPVAFFTRSYWALVIGNLASAVANAILMMVLSSWKPSRFYSSAILRKMFRISFWFLCESTAHWCILWIDIFLIGMSFYAYDVGIYKNSTYVVTTLLNMIVVAVGPVLMSAIARIRDRDEQYECFRHFIRLAAYVALPVGIGLFFYRETVTLILFGPAWSDAADIIGVWGISVSLNLLFYSFPAEVYKSKGMGKILFIFQCIYLACLLPAILFSIGGGFWCFVYVRSFCVIVPTILCPVFMHLFLKWNVGRFVRDMIPAFLSAGFVALLCAVFRACFHQSAWTIACIPCIALLYCLFLWVTQRKQLFASLQYIVSKRV